MSEAERRNFFGKLPIAYSRWEYAKQIDIERFLNILFNWGI